MLILFLSAFACWLPVAAPCVSQFIHRVLGNTVGHTHTVPAVHKVHAHADCSTYNSTVQLTLYCIFYR